MTAEYSQLKIRIPASLEEQLELLREERGMTLNGLVNKLLEEGINHRCSDAGINEALLRSIVIGDITVSPEGIEQALGAILKGGE